MRHTFSLLTLLAVCSCLFGQATTDNRNGAVGYPYPERASDPGTCTVRQMYRNSTTGHLRDCVATNKWADATIPGAAVGPLIVPTVGDIPATCSIGQSAFVSGNPVGQQGYDCTAVNAWTQRVGKDASGNVTLGTTVLGTASVAPTCSTYTVSSANAGFQAAAVTANITLVALPARAKITGINVKHSVAFAGTAVTSTTVSVGDGTSTFDQYASVYNVFQAVGNTAFLDSVEFKSTTMAASNVVAHFVANTNFGTGSATVLTAGSVAISVCSVTLP